MRLTTLGFVMLAAYGLSWLITPPEANTTDLPRLPGAVLLVGYPPDSLFLTLDQRTIDLQAHDGAQSLIRPSISLDGNIVASARSAVSDGSAPSPGLIVSTYSVAEKKWTAYKDLEIAVGSVAISADGSKVACITRTMPAAPSGLRILDLKTGKITDGPGMQERSGSSISWSPDGRRLALDMGAERPKNSITDPLRRAIYIVNIDTRAVSRIADGMSPSWSPSGQWIAFVNHAEESKESKFQFCLMRPDGKDSQVLSTFRSDVVPYLKPVWSPDSKLLLINKSRNPDLDTWDIEIIDVATHEVNRRFSSVPPVFGWASP